MPGMAQRSTATVLIGQLIGQLIEEKFPQPCAALRCSPSSSPTAARCASTPRRGRRIPEIAHAGRSCDLFYPEFRYPLYVPATAERVVLPCSHPGISLTLRRASTGRPVLRCQRAPQRLEYGDGNDVEAGVIALLGPPLNHQFNQSHTNWPALDMHAGPGARGRDELGVGRTIACGVLSD